MDHLIVYYSRTGTTKRLAKKIKKEMGCDEEEIFDKKDRTGILGFISSGWDALRGKETEIYGGKKDPSDYDHVFIGTPVWVGKPTPAIRTYMEKRKYDLEKVSYFCTYGGSGGGKVLNEMEELCGKKPKNTLGLKSEKIEEQRFDEEVEQFIGEWIE